MTSEGARSEAVAYWKDGSGAGGLFQDSWLMRCRGRAVRASKDGYDRTCAAESLLQREGRLDSAVRR
jgi:hypothetical protein